MCFDKSTCRTAPLKHITDVGVNSLAFRALMLSSTLPPRVDFKLKCEDTTMAAAANGTVIPSLAICTHVATAMEAPSSELMKTVRQLPR